MNDSLWRWLGAGVVVGALGCGESGDDGTDPNGPTPPGDDQTTQQENPASDDPSVNPGQPPGSNPKPVPPGESPDPVVPAPTLLASLAPAADCTDLLTKIQNDAIAKLKMQVELYKSQPPMTAPGGRPVGGARDASAGRGATGTGGLAPPPSPGAAPGGPNWSAGEESAADNSTASPTAPPPTGASDTNKQVAGVDEADFVKVVENGQGMFLLHGSTLVKLNSWPAAETALEGQPLTIEGSPSEMFVTDEGKAVVFSSVYGYPVTTPGGGGGGIAVDIACGPGFCGGTGSVKITVADVSTDTPKVERELYYEGWYVSSRRYDSDASDVVRAIVQGSSKYGGLYAPDIEWYDAWGRPYDQANIASQLDEWEQRTTASIRNTALSDWLPTGKEVKDGKLVDIAPDCDSYFVPEPGLADYGLTHVLSLDVAQPGQPVGGVTIVGGASTVYSNADRLVLAQPDYRWSGRGDFGIADQQQTALHVFELAAAQTKYVASGWVFGSLPSHNPQFGIDVAADGTLRVATTGFVRDRPDAKPEDQDFWAQHTENYVTTARVQGMKLEVVGKSQKLGHEDETVQSARFVGDRAYVVTFRQTDPLIVVDVANAASPTVLGEIEIPGFSQYMHPLDANHLITVGQSGNGGIQLQLFDVTNPMNIPAPKVLDFGSGSSSEVSYNHKAFTFYQGLLAVPVWNNGYSRNRYTYSSALEVIRVDAATGFMHLGTIDHARLYANNGAGVMCGYCDELGCYDYSCGYYNPEVRRGHFVQSEDKTYVYSFSYAGVLVNDLSYLTRPVASVGLPAPGMPGYQPWYGPDGLPVPPVQDAGVAVPPDRPVPPTAADAGVGVRDGGTATVSP